MKIVAVAYVFGDCIGKGTFESVPDHDEKAGGLQHTDMVRGITEDNKTHMFPASAARYEVEKVEA